MALVRNNRFCIFSSRKVYLLTYNNISMYLLRFWNVVETMKNLFPITGECIYIHAHIYIYTYIFLYTYTLSLDICVTCTFICICICIYLMPHCQHVACFITLKNSCFISLIHMQWVTWKKMFWSKYMGCWLDSISDLGCVHFIFRWGVHLRFVHISLGLRYFTK